MERFSDEVRLVTIVTLAILLLLSAAFPPPLVLAGDGFDFLTWNVSYRSLAILGNIPKKVSKNLLQLIYINESHSLILGRYRYIVGTLNQSICFKIFILGLDFIH